MPVRRVALCNVIYTLILHYTRTFYIKSKFMENVINCLLFVYGTFKITDHLKRLHIRLSTCRRPIHILFNFACFRIELLNSIFT